MDDSNCILLSLRDQRSTQRKDHLASILRWLPKTATSDRQQAMKRQQGVEMVWMMVEW